jgi:hypothetical protein
MEISHLADWRRASLPIVTLGLDPRIHAGTLRSCVGVAVDSSLSPQHRFGLVGAAGVPPRDHHALTAPAHPT